MIYRLYIFLYIIRLRQKYFINISMEKNKFTLFFTKYIFRRKTQYQNPYDIYL